MSKLTKPQIERLETLLCRSLSHAESVHTEYDQITADNLIDIKNLVLRGATIDAIMYVIFLLGEAGDLKNAMSFVDNVIKKKLELKVWLERYYKPQLR